MPDIDETSSNALEKSTRNASYSVCFPSDSWQPSPELSVWLSLDSLFLKIVIIYAVPFKNSHNDKQYLTLLNRILES